MAHQGTAEGNQFEAYQNDVPLERQRKDSYDYVYVRPIDSTYYIWKSR